MEEKLIDDKAGEYEQQCSMNDNAGVEEERLPGINANKDEKVHGAKLKNESPSESKLHLIGKNCTQGSLFHGIQVTDLRIPKYMCFTNLSKSYLQYYLGLVEFKAANSLSPACSPTIPCNISVNLISSSKDVLLDRNSVPYQRTSKGTSDLGPFVIQCTPSSTSGQWIVSTIGKNPSARIIPKDPLLHPLGALRSIINIAGVGIMNFKGIKSTASMSYPLKHGFDSPKKPTREEVYNRNQKHGSKSLNKRLFSFSSTKYAGLDQSSQPSSATYHQGVLQCKLDDGSTLFLYSVSGHKEAYVAKVSKVESLNHKALDYVYTFYTRKVGRRVQGNHDGFVDVLVGKMKVSSSLSLCTNSNNSKHKETEFVLFGADAEHYKNTARSASVLGKPKVYPNKVADIFKPKQLQKSISLLKSGAQSSIPEEVNFDPHMLHKLGSENFLGGPPNFELAAIVVRELVHDNQETNLGGWGLKFLERARVECPHTSKKASILSENSRKGCNSNCSSTVNVIIPADYHGGPVTGSGGPVTGSGGPSSLTERWRSGGHCDCGGWDMGCRLTILSNQDEAMSNDSAKEPKTLNLVLEGTKQNIPYLKMLTTNNNEYQIQFQSSLSTLQSFSIGVAFIHIQSQSKTSPDTRS